MTRINIFDKHIKRIGSHVSVIYVFPDFADNCPRTEMLIFDVLLMKEMQINLIYLQGFGFQQLIR